MKNVTDSFKSAIKARARTTKIKLEFDMGQTPLVFTAEGIQEVKYVAEAKRELGGVEEQILKIKLMKDQVPIDIYNTEVYVEAYVGVGDPVEWCSMGIFSTEYWSKEDSKGTITVECVDILKKKCDKQMPFIPTMRETTKINYLNTLNNKIGIASSITGLHDGKLFMAMLGGTKVVDTLRPLMLAMNGLARGRETIEYVPFKAKTVQQDNLTYSNMLYSVEGGKDGILEYDAVNVCVYLPSSDEYREIAKLKDLKVPASHTNFRVGSVAFSDPKVTKCISFDHEVIIRDFNISTEKVSIDIDNPSVSSINLNVKVDGSDLQDVNISNSDDTTNKIKNVQNIYIQDAESISTLDTRIYTSQEIKAKYRGLPYLEIGDTVAIEDIGNVLVTYQELTYNGALSGNLRGVLVVD